MFMVIRRFTILYRIPKFDFFFAPHQSQKNRKAMREYNLPKWKITFVIWQSQENSKNWSVAQLRTAGWPHQASHTWMWSLHCVHYIKQVWNIFLSDSHEIENIAASLSLILANSQSESFFTKWWNFVLSCSETSSASSQTMGNFSSTTILYRDYQMWMLTLW